MKKILVTGGAGFIGTHLVNDLMAAGHHVMCLDNCFTGREDNLRHHLSSERFQFIHHDVVDPIEIEGLDQIYHMACPASPVHYQYDPIKTLKTSVIGTLNMLDLALKNQARILFASTSEVYGDPTVHPQTEEYRGNVNPIGIRACYDEGKRAGETLMFDYHRYHGVDIAVIRIFNTYGPGMRKDDGRVVSNFIIQALTGQPLTLYGDGSQTRSFCYVQDLVNGIVAMMNSSITGPVNLGNPVEFTVKELALKVKDLVGSHSELVYEPLPLDDPKQRQPDISKARDLLNWIPQVPLEEGLKLTIPDFARRLNS
jgi:UDP-glucuronate decarboxylase